MEFIDRIKKQDGLTILEVLIASAVFMIGFSIMTFLLSEIVGKYSIKDQAIAYNLAQKYMEMTLASGSYSDSTLTENVSNIAFKIERLVNKESNLFKIRINVIRQKTSKLMVSLYDEKYIR